MGKILLLLPNNPGDVLMATPAIRILKNSGESVHFLVDNDCSDMVTYNPNIEKVFVLPRRKIKNLLSGRDWRKGLSELKDFSALLQSEHYDRVINLFQGQLTAILSALIPCKEFTGTRMQRNGRTEIIGDLTTLLYAIPFSRRYVPAHAADFYTLLCGKLPDGKPMELFLPDRAKSFARKLMREKGFTQDKLIVIHPCSAHLKKEWPHEHVTGLLNLLREAGYQVVFTGSTREKDRVAALITLSKFPDTINLCGSANFLESAAVMGSARCVVSGDTVAVHIAAGLGVKSISIFAPTSPMETGPYASGCTIFTSDCLCFGAYSGFCPVGQRCTGRISPINILDEIEGRSPSLPALCKRLVSSFDPASGLIDYSEKGKSGYLPSARAILGIYSEAKVSRAGSLTLREKSALDRMERRLTDNAKCLIRITDTKGKDKLKVLLEENSGIERDINSLSGAAAYLSSVLRFKNNSMSAVDIHDLASGLLKNCREIMLKIKALNGYLPLETSEEKSPSVKIIIPAKNKEEVTESIKDAFKNAVDYPDIQVEEVDDRADSINKRVRESGVDYVLLLNRGVIPTAGFIEEMVSAFNRDPDCAVCVAKVLYKDDTVHHAALEFNRKRDFTPILYRMGRFAPEVTQYREVLASEMYCVLVKREIFTSTNGFEENYTPIYRFIDFCMKIHAAKKKILYCPDAEVYFEPIDSKMPSASDLDRDQWKLLEKWKSLPALARPIEPLESLSGINA